MSEAARSARITCPQRQRGDLGRASSLIEPRVETTADPASGSAFDISRRARAKSDPPTPRFEWGVSALVLGSALLWPRRCRNIVMQIHDRQRQPIHFVVLTIRDGPDCCCWATARVSRSASWGSSALQERAALPAEPGRRRRVGLSLFLWLLNAVVLIRAGTVESAAMSTAGEPSSTEAARGTVWIRPSGRRNVMMGPTSIVQRVMNATSEIPWRRSLFSKADPQDATTCHVAASSANC